MEWKINRERIPVTERILDETQEQGVELDYVLPDYDPEIFRIIRCEMQPAILEYQLQETRLSYELQVDLRILYCGSDSHRLQCVTQTMHYTKTLDLPEKPENPAVLLQAKADYANCRAVSRRRLDVLSGIFPMQQNCSGKKNWCRMHFIGLESCIQNFCRLSVENSVRIIGIRHNIQLLLRQMENQSVVFMRNAAIG